MISNLNGSGSVRVHQKKSGFYQFAVQVRVRFDFLLRFDSLLTTISSKELDMDKQNGKNGKIQQKQIRHVCLEENDCKENKTYPKNIDDRK